ncbi:MAG: hypothetical protein Q9163_002136 [Psora crenata]
MVEVAQPLAPFLRRPPTPPKESTFKQAEESALQKDLPSHSLLDTPEESPSSSAECIKNISERARKKVGFSGWTKFHKPPTVGSTGYESDDLRPLPPSRDCKSSKSILKPSAEVTTVDGAKDFTLDNSSLPAMLRSAIQHMSSDSRASRLDAYSSLLACLSTYEDEPSVEELAGSVAEITGRMRRDLSTRASSEDGPMDVQLATQALKLLTYFLCTPSLAFNVPEEFQLFIIERSLSSLEEENCPKILVSHYMHLLERQKFGPKVITLERANKLLSTLDTMTIRVRGNRIVSHRIMIYHRLLGQAKSLMASRVESWIDHLIAGLLSTIKDVRTRAITFGIEAGLQLGITNNVSDALVDVFNRRSSGGEKIVDLLCSRLTDMISNRGDAVHVPPIWSIFILFLRSRRQQIERWEHLKAWLIIIQRCFNSGDAQVKFQANIAWNRLIFALNIETIASPQSSTSSSLANMLKQPIISQLQRNRSDKSGEKNSRLAKQVARSSYCTLLYYALRPTASHEQLDQYWDLYVSAIIPKSFLMTKTDINHACDILAALFSSSGQHRVWDNNRANMNGPVRPDELPCLDSKWVRSRTGKIMQIFDKLFNLADWQLDTDREAPIVLSWRQLMSAIGDASSKEIKASTDTMTALAHILDQVKRFMSQTYDQQSPREALKRVYVLVQEAVAKVGNLAFNEKRLVLKNHTCFEVTSETPSSRSRRIQETPNSAAIHLLDLLLLHSHDGYEHSDVLNIARYYVALILQSAHYRHSRLSTLRSLAAWLFSKRSELSLSPQLLLWQVIADIASSTLRISRTAESHSDISQSPGHEYRDAVKILEIGVRLHSTDVLGDWCRLYEQVMETIGQEIGHEGATIMVTEPLAAAICTEVEVKCDEPSVNAALKILEGVHWPQSRKLLERAQFQLWGTIHRSQKSMAPDPCGNLYRLIDSVLLRTYARVDTLSAGAQLSVIATVTSVLHSCPPSTRPDLLGKIERGLAAWIEDVDGTLAGPKHSLYPQVKKMWALAAAIIESVPESRSNFLATIDILVTASLRSRHKAILNEAVVMWNRAFGCAESLDYSKDLQRALLKLTTVTDIDLPGFPEATEQEKESSPFRFPVTQEVEDRDYATAIARPRPSHEVGLFQRLRSSKGRAFSDSPQPLRASPSPLRSARRSMTTTPKAQFRHDDSQIQFAPVESSPFATSNDESQLLTDRQKEVQERQRHKAAMFPEVGSRLGAEPKASITTLPKLAFKQKQTPAPGLDTDEDNSPTFPPDPIMNGFLGSSPTPSSNRNRSEERFTDDGPPSSPPLVSSHLQVRRERPPLLQKSANLPFQVPLGSDGQHCVPPPIEDQAEITNGANHDKAGQLGVQQRNLPDTKVLSDMDVYLDAPSEPQVDSPGGPLEARANKKVWRGQSENISRHVTGLEARPAPKHGPSLQKGPEDPDVSKVMDSFQSNSSARIPNENDQATAQLLAEMQSAQSQGSSGLGADAGLAQASRKRKIPTNNAPRKRAKVSKAAQRSSKVIEAPRAGEAVADCVLIDACPARDMFEPTSPEALVKKELSTSPRVASLGFTVEETPIPGRQRSGRRRQMPASDETSHGPTRTTRSARKVKIKEETENEPNAPHSLPKRRRRRWRKSDDTSSVYVDTSSDPLHADDSLPQIPTSSSAINVSLPAGEDLSDCGPSVIRPGEAQQETVGGDLHTDSRLRNGPTPRSILDGFRSMSDHIKQVALGPEEERALVSILFETVQLVHEAGLVSIVSAAWSDFGDVGCGTGIAMNSFVEEHCFFPLNLTPTFNATQGINPSEANITMDRPKKPAAIPVSPTIPVPQVSISQDNLRVTASLPTGESIEVLLAGATVISWKSAQGKENLFLSSKAHLDGSKPVRGGIPLVFPVFGPPPASHPTSGLPQHGFARISNWEYLGKSSSESSTLPNSTGDSSVKLDFGLSNSMLSDLPSEWKNYHFGITYSVTLSRDDLETTLMIRNTGDKAFEFQTLFHSYLAVDDISQVSITGIESTPYVDKAGGYKQTAASNRPLTISSEVDRIYSPPLSEAITIAEKEKPKYEITRDELGDVVVWNPWQDKASGMADFGPADGWKKMVCVEPGSVSGWTSLEAGDSWEGGQRIKLC